MSKRRKSAAAPKANLPFSDITHPFKTNILCAGLIAAVTLAALWPLTSAEFTTWDDAGTIWKNWALNPPVAAGLEHHWRHPHMDLWVPVTYTVWWATAQAALPKGGITAGMLNAHVFHTLNVLLHVASALIVFRILSRIVRHPWVACAGAMLFALHPLQVETVGWASGTKDLLFGFLSLLAIAQYMTFVSMEPADKRRWLAYAVATTAFALAMLSKPTAIVLPLIAATIDLLIARRPARTVALSLAPWLILALPVGIVAKLVQPALHSGTPPLWLRPLIAGDALAFYLYKLVVPLPSGVDYGRTPQHVLDSGVAYVSWMLPAAAAVGAWMCRRRVPAIAAGALIFALGLAPLLGIVPFDFQRYSTVADHYLYSPMFGVALAASAALARWQPRRWTIAVATAILVTLGGLSWVQTRYWHDTRSLFEHALAVNPRSAAGHNSLASYYIMIGQPAPAIEHATKAIELSPERPLAYVTLGSAYAMQRNLVEAETNFRRAVELAPDDSMALGNLSGLLAEKGQLDKAVTLARRAVELDATNVSARTNLGSMLAQSGHWTEAAPELETAVRLDPRDVRARSNLGTVMLHLGRLDRAAAEYRTALQIDPNFPPAQRGMADVQKARQQSPSRIP